CLTATRRPRNSRRPYTGGAAPVRVAAPVHRPTKQPRENVSDQQKHSDNTKSVRNYNTVIKAMVYYNDTAGGYRTGAGESYFDASPNLSGKLSVP
ncbi:MAG: hypothetical protein QOC62_2127, partial [Mycobacterium sp.]|nr:hypothetical protein [Mycobacterium sp.]